MHAVHSGLSKSHNFRRFLQVKQPFRVRLIWPRFREEGPTEKDCSRDGPCAVIGEDPSDDIV
jgi:hypothetical protein